MTKAQDIVRGSLKRLGVIDSHEEPSSQDAADTLAALNRMLNSWAGRGVDVGHMDLTSFAEFPLDATFEDPVIALLAVRVAPDFNEPVSAQLKEDAVDGWYIVQAGYIEAPRADIDPTLLRLPSQRLFGIATTT